MELVFPPSEEREKLAITNKSRQKKSSASRPVERKTVEHHRKSAPYDTRPSGHKQRHQGLQGAGANTLKHPKASHRFRSQQRSSSSTGGGGPWTAQITALLVVQISQRLSSLVVQRVLATILNQSQSFGF